MIDPNAVTDPARSPRQLEEFLLFCIVVAGVECMIMPFGTVLGVFTLIMLMKDSVKALFESGVPPELVPPMTAGK